MLIIAPDQEAYRDIFSIFFNMKVDCVFSLESPHRGDSNEYTQYTIFIIKMKSPQIILNLQLRVFFLGTQERVQNSRGKRAISFEPLKFYCMCKWATMVLTCS